MKTTATVVLLYAFVAGAGASAIGSRDLSCNAIPVTASKLYYKIIDKNTDPTAGKPAYETVGARYISEMDNLPCAQGQTNKFQLTDASGCNPADPSAGIVEMKPGFEAVWVGPAAYSIKDIIPDGQSFACDKGSVDVSILFNTRDAAKNYGLKVTA